MHRRAFASVALVLGLLFLTSGASSLASMPVGERFEPLVLDLSAHRGAFEAALADPPETLPENAEKIGPGSNLYLLGLNGPNACTANFVFRVNETYYLGTAGHCILPDTGATYGSAAIDVSSVRVWACAAQCHSGGTGALGLNVAGAMEQVSLYLELGPVVFALYEGVDPRPNGRDFALIEIPRAFVDAGFVRSEMPVFDGPRGTRFLYIGDNLCLYGSGAGFGETVATRARIGLIPTREVYDLIRGGPMSGWVGILPAAPGDSGAAVVRCEVDGDAIVGREAGGLLTHILNSGAVTGTRISTAMALAREGGFAIELVEAGDDFA